MTENTELTINNKLPNETLVMIFEILIEDTKEEQCKLLRKRTANKEIYRYYNNCEHCTKTMRGEAWNWIHRGNINARTDEELLREDYHYNVHRRLRNMNNMTIQSMKMSKHFMKIYSAIATCKNWRHAYYHKYEDMCKQNKALRTITERILDYMVQDPVQTIWNYYYNESVKNTTAKYRYLSNALLLNKYFRNKYYDIVVTTEIKTIVIKRKGRYAYNSDFTIIPRKHCNLCKHSVIEEYEGRTYTQIKEGLKGKDKHTVRRHANTAYCKYRLIDTKTIRGQRIEWWCNKGCETHCLNSFNHCNRNKTYRSIRLNKKQYIKWRTQVYPKDLLVKESK